MAFAGYGVQVLAYTASAAPASTNFVAVGGTKSVTANDSINMLDTSAFGDAGLRRRIGGLRDGTLAISGDHEATDTGWGYILDGFLGDDDVYVQFVYDGSNGYEYECIVENLSLSASVDGLIETSATLHVQAEPLAVT